jgi:hypothetical protein
MSLLQVSLKAGARHPMRQTDAVAEITDQYMQDHLAQTREYAVALLRAGEQFGSEGSDAIVWEHGRRNFSLRADGLLSIVCPVADDSDLCGVAIFDTSVEQASQIMDGDPGVRAGVFTYDVHPVRSFPGDALPR